jgi:hypothetical protein
MQRKQLETMSCEEGTRGKSLQGSRDSWPSPKSWLVRCFSARPVSTVEGGFRISEVAGASSHGSTGHNRKPVTSPKPEAVLRQSSAHGGCAVRYGEDCDRPPPTAHLSPFSKHMSSFASLLRVSRHGQGLPSNSELECFGRSCLAVAGKPHGGVLGNPHLCTLTVPRKHQVSPTYSGLPHPLCLGISRVPEAVEISLKPLILLVAAFFVVFEPFTSCFVGL